MSNLIAKIMSSENLPDSDNRKAYKLIPVPVDHEIEFRRNGPTHHPEMLFSPLFGEPCGMTIPLIDCGNVYILDNGKTVSSFGVGATVHKGSVEGTLLSVSSDSTVTIAAKELSVSSDQSVTFDVKDALYYTQLMNMFTAVMDFQNHPQYEPWCHEIASAIASLPSPLPHTGVEIRLTSTTPVYPEALYSFRQMLNDTLLNGKPMLEISGAIELMTNYTLSLTIRTPAEIPPLFHENQTGREAMIQKGISHSVCNAMQRAVKLYRYGASFVVINPTLKITPGERSAIRFLFDKWCHAGVDFINLGDHVIMFRFSSAKL